MTRQTIAVFIFAMTFVSCQQDLLGDSKVAADICTDLDADNCKYFYSTEQKSGKAEWNEYIEFEIYGCNTLNKERTNKRALASYAATQLYRRLDSNSIKGNSGINIIFDSIDDILKDKELYFEMSELKNASTAFNLVDSYVNAVRTNNLKQANSLIDTSFFELNVTEINAAIQEKINLPVISSSNMFDYYNFPSNSGKTIKCLTILTNIKHDDKKFSQINFLVLDTPTDKKIINIKPGP